MYFMIFIIFTHRTLLSRPEGGVADLCPVFVDGSGRHVLESDVGGDGEQVLDAEGGHYGQLLGADLVLAQIHNGVKCLLLRCVGVRVRVRV